MSGMLLPADWSIIIGITLIGVIDVLFIVHKTPTISRRFRAVGYRLSFLPYAWGAIGGHFWGPHRLPAFGSWWWSIATLALFGLALSVVHRIMLRWVDPPDWVPLVYLPCGAVMGVFFWPQ